MYSKQNIKTFLIFALILLCFPASSCSTSLNKLNQIAQESLKEHEVRKTEVSVLNTKYIGLDKNKILEVFGKPKDVSNEPYPYLIDLDCKSIDCPKDYSDEIWFYEINESFGNWHSLYVYFKNNHVVRIR